MRKLVLIVVEIASAVLSPVFAASIGSESSVGLAVDANSNPYLLSSGAKAAESGAFLLNLPVTYNGDENTLDLIPRVRLAETHGDAQLLSNYQYLDADWRFAGERNTLSATADWHRDSTFYNVFENAALHGHTVYRQEDLASFAWQRQLNERSDAQISGSYDRLDYDAAAGQRLVSYQYAQGAAQYDHQLGERWQASLIGGYGSYQLIHSTYRSQQEFAQVALSRLLSERWSVKAQVGYSWLQDRLVQPEAFCPVSIVYCIFGIYPFETVEVTRHTSSNAGNGLLTLERTYPRAAVDLAASRAIVPSGLGGLVKQTDVSLSGRYQLSARWQLSATAHAAALAGATAELQLGTRRYADLDLSGTWQWTEHWTLQLTAAELVQDTNGQYARSVALSVGAFRQFGRVRLR